MEQQQRQQRPGAARSGMEQQQRQQRPGAALAPPPAAAAAAAPEPPGADALALVLSLCEPAALGRCRAVCRAWRAAASERDVRRAAFLRHWGLAGCTGQPRQPAFYETAAPHSFARAHAVARGDSLAALAVRSGQDVHSIKRANNLMSDHSLHSRTHIFIPVTGREQLQDQVVSFAWCPLSKREFAVLPSGAATPAAAGAAATPASAHHAPAPAGEGGAAFKLEADAEKLCALLGRSLRVDAATASYYLHEAGGDVKAAMAAAAHDLAWEATTAGPIRAAPVQRWIRGEAGL
ncbi:F-box protein [Scenedesmus sp. PABB004]|nr:F-box protein [Scenedesmus sp. PABB004]